MNSKIILIIVALVLSISACQKGEYLSEGDFFHVDHNGAKLPVWVTGNFDSDVILITVHGGPGDSGMGFHTDPGFQKLEKDYIIVYWDQRFSGMAQGHTDIETMNPEQFYEDTDIVVQVIQHRYPGKKLFMLGHSWGGQVTSGYLGRDNHDSNFKGWIDLNGSIHSVMEAQMMKDWILQRVPEKLAEPGADTEFWQFIVDWYEANPAPGAYTAFEPYWYTTSLGGDVYDYEVYLEKNAIPYVELIFKSMFSLSYYVNSFGNPEDVVEWDDIDCTPQLQNITIPALMLWGADDGIVPAQVADYVYDHLSTDEEMKKVVKIPNCGHGPQSEKPEEFYNEITDFIETYKNL
jgi:pimeloyl-ACP methyl ester carboxylesterase